MVDFRSLCALWPSTLTTRHQLPHLLPGSVIWRSLARPHTNLTSLESPLPYIPELLGRGIWVSLDWKWMVGICQFSFARNYCRHWQEGFWAGDGVHRIKVDTGNSHIAKREPRRLWVNCTKTSAKRHFLEFAGTWQHGDTWPPFESELSLSYLPSMR